MHVCAVCSKCLHVWTSYPVDVVIPTNKRIISPSTVSHYRGEEIQSVGRGNDRVRNASIDSVTNESCVEQRSSVCTVRKRLCCLWGAWLLCIFNTGKDIGNQELHECQTFNQGILPTNNHLYFSIRNFVKIPMEEPRFGPREVRCEIAGRRKRFSGTSKGACVCVCAYWNI